MVSVMIENGLYYERCYCISSGNKEGFNNTTAIQKKKKKRLSDSLALQKEILNSYQPTYILRESKQHMQIEIYAKMFVKNIQVEFLF